MHKLLAFLNLTIDKGTIIFDNILYIFSIQFYLFCGEFLQFSLEKNIKSFNRTGVPLP